MKILVTGSKGQLGRELTRQSKDFGFEVLAADLPELDITDLIQVEDMVEKSQASLVINAAAYTNVDRAETEQELAFAVNTTGPANLAVSCAKVDIPLIQISTDFVFDGKKGTPYIETDPVSPLSVYGKSKADGDNKVRSKAKKHIILRTSWLYGLYGQNFVKTMLRLGNEKESIKVVADQFGSPTSATDLAETLLAIADKIQNSSTVNWGTYHYCGHGVTTWHGFAEKIFEIARKYESIKITNVKPVTTSEYSTKAKRPSFSALDCSLIKKYFEITPEPWQKSLEIIINQIYSDKRRMK